MGGGPVRCENTEKCRNLSVPIAAVPRRLCGPHHDRRTRKVRPRASIYFFLHELKPLARAIGTERNALALEEQYHTYASRDAMKPYGANWVGLCLRREHCNGWSRAWYDSWECRGGD